MKPIDPKRFYSLGEIVRQGLIPGVDNIPTASRLVNNDLLFNKVLQAKRVLSVNGHVQYKIKGSNIINYLVQTEQ